MPEISFSGNALEITWRPLMIHKWNVSTWIVLGTLRTKKYKRWVEWELVSFDAHYRSWMMRSTSNISDWVWGLPKAKRKIRFIAKHRIAMPGLFSMMASMNSVVEFVKRVIVFHVDVFMKERHARSIRMNWQLGLAMMKLPERTWSFWRISSPPVRLCIARDAGLSFKRHKAVTEWHAKCVKLQYAGLLRVLGGVQR